MKTGITIFLLSLWVCTVTGQLKQNCRIDSSHYYYYVDSPAAKVLLNRTFITFNNKEHPVQSLTYYRPFDSTQWELSYRESYIYDSRGTVSEYLKQSWDAMGKSWKNDYKYFYLYTTRGQEIESFKQYWYAGKWYNDYKIRRDYDTAGRELDMLWLHWDSDLDEWVNEMKYTSSFNHEGRLNELLRLSWDPVNKTWKNFGKDLYFYDSMGLDTTSIALRWNQGIFINYQKYTTSYNAAGLKTEFIYQSWWNNQWNNESKEVYEYTADGCLSNYHYYFDWITDNTWRQHSEDRYVFPQPELTLPDFNMYPNPANSFLKIFTRIETPYTLVDMCGNTILEGLAVKGENQVNIQHLSSGIYIVLTPNKTMKLLVARH